MSTLIIENIYGHAKRLDWILSNINKEDVLLEVGCGTGYMISLPLAKMGYYITGIDTDNESIIYGQRMLNEAGLNPKILIAIDFAKIDIVPDVIIASEVLEHIPEENLDSLLSAIYIKLKPGGKFLVTVPNGYGWFELESFLCNRLYLGRLLESRIADMTKKIKKYLFGESIDDLHPSTLSSSPHVQRFTLQSIQRKLIEHRFEILEAQGSVLFCGQFSNYLFTGIKPIMKLNAWLGKQFPKIAASFYIAAIKR